MTAPPVNRTRDGSRRSWPDVRRAAFRLVPAAVLVWLVMCSVGYLLVHPLTRAGFTNWEGGADRWFAHHRSATWNSITNFASLAGDTPAAIGITVLAFITLRLLLHRWAEAILLAVAMIGEVCIFSSTTIVVGRNRPAVAHLDGSPPTSSFPSGHTAASTTLYTVLVIVVFTCTTRAAWRALAVALAAFIVLSIGLSRLYRGMHYPSDVLGGVMLGLLWAAATSLVLLPTNTTEHRG
ncbi:phosphatase PAP2 family protein [Jatrophihabitans sp. DSM 45814]